MRHAFLWWQDTCGCAKSLGHAHLSTSCWSASHLDSRTPLQLRRAGENTENCYMKVHVLLARHRLHVDCCMSNSQVYLCCGRDWWLRYWAESDRPLRKPPERWLLGQEIFWCRHRCVVICNASVRVWCVRAVLSVQVCFWGAHVRVRQFTAPLVLIGCCGFRACQMPNMIVYVETLTGPDKPLAYCWCCCFGQVWWERPPVATWWSFRLRLVRTARFRKPSSRRLGADRRLLVALLPQNGSREWISKRQSRSRTLKLLSIWACRPWSFTALCSRRMRSRQL